MLHFLGQSAAPTMPYNTLQQPLYITPYHNPHVSYSAQYQPQFQPLYQPQYLQPPQYQHVAVHQNQPVNGSGVVSSEATTAPAAECTSPNSSG
jgi:hypothetical protein